MKVLFIAGVDIAILHNHRAQHFIAFLEQLGVQMDIISLTPFYTGPWPANPWTRFRYGLRESIGNPISVLKRKTGVEVAIRRLPSRLDAFAHSLWAYLHLGPLASERYDVCIFGNPDNVLLPLFLKKRGLVGTIIYDDWDFYPGFDQSWLRNRLTRYREHLCVSLADVVISVGSLLSELRKSQGAARTLVIPNGVNYNLFATAQRKRSHPPTLVYTGNLAEDWGVDVSIEGFALVRKQIPEARYLIIGYNEGRYVDYLHNLVNQLGLSESVLFLGPKRYEELPHYLAEADIGVALHKPNELMRYAVPLKVVEYMAAGLSVVGTGVGETEKLILEGESGKCVPYSSEDFAGAVLDILSDSAVLTCYCEHAKEYAKRFDWDSLFSGLPDVIDTAVLTQGRKATMTPKQSAQTPPLNHLMAYLRARKAFLADVFVGRNRILLTNKQHMRFAAEWLAAAQDATPDGGVSALYSMRTGWDVSYPETTGYIIPTLLNYFRLAGQSIWRDRAIRMADWLLSIQLSDGAFPLRADLVTPAVFDTGQIIFGMIGAFHETRAKQYLDSAIRASQWLTSIQEPTGAWLRYSYGGISHAYYTRVAWALLEVHKEWDDGELLLAARKNLMWAMVQQLENGWFRNNAFSVDEYPSLHTIAYVAQGLLEAGEIIQDQQYIQAAAKIADALLVRQLKDGALHGVYDQDWRPTVGWTCLTGNAQMSIIWLKLYLSRGNKAYFEAAKKANSYLKSVQNLMASDPGVRGGIKGSYPINGAYMPYAYPNWATKFFLDALMLEERATALPDPSALAVGGNMEVAG